MNKRIKNLRKALNLTQQEFADRLNIGRGTLANYEVGRNEPIDAVVSLICHEFGVNENWLRTGDGSMFKKETNTAIEELAAEFYLDSFDEALIQEYVVLAPNQKKMFRTFFYRVLMKSIGESAPEELLKTEMGYPSAEEAEIISKQMEKGIIQQYLAQKRQQGNVDMGVEAEISSSAIGKDISVPSAPNTGGSERSEPDLAAKVSELERQNQELTAKVAAMEEEDALLGLTDAFSASPSVSAGSSRPVEKVKK